MRTNASELRHLMSSQSPQPPHVVNDLACDLDEIREVVLDILRMKRQHRCNERSCYIERLRSLNLE